MWSGSERRFVKSSLNHQMGIKSYFIDIGFKFSFDLSQENYLNTRCVCVQEGSKGQKSLDVYFDAIVTEFLSTFLCSQVSSC